MKISFLILALLLSAVVYSNIQFENIQLEVVEKYEPNSSNAVVLGTDFAEAVILNEDLIKKLEKQRIYHIDLVYTRFKRSADFDQEALNKKRIEELKALIPDLDSYQPGWSLVEQTGANKVEDAENYFHGFVLHFAPELNFANSQSHTFYDFNAFEVDNVNNEIGGNLIYPDGTILKIPAGAVSYEDGSPVEGDYQILFREFRTQSEILLSGIPMKYTGNGNQNEIFNSVGMFEIRGTKNGRNLVLNQPIEVDFTVNQALPNVSFYEMSNQGIWKEHHPILFDESTIIQADKREEGLSAKDMFSNKRVSVESRGDESVFGDSPMTLDEIVTLRDMKSFIVTVYPEETELDFDGEFQGWNRIKDKYQVLKQTIQLGLNGKAWKSYNELCESEGDDFKQLIHFVDANERTIRVMKDSVRYVAEKILNAPMAEVRAEKKGQKTRYIYLPSPTFTESKTVEEIAEQMNGPQRVRALLVSNFNVFNCDQTQQIAEPVVMRPKYFDQDSGREIEKACYAYVIDLNITAALSYAPSLIVCNEAANNKLVLMTSDREIYFADFTEEGLPENRDEIEMSNITAEVSDPEDLQELLAP